MWLFDIAAVVFLASFFNMVVFLFKGNRSAALVSVVFEIVCALIMLVAYYIVAGNELAIEKMLFK